MSDKAPDAVPAIDQTSEAYTRFSNWILNGSEGVSTFPN